MLSINHNHVCSAAFLNMLRHSRIKFVDLRWNNFGTDELCEIRAEEGSNDEDAFAAIVRKLIFIPREHVVDSMHRWYPEAVVSAHRRYYGPSDSESEGGLGEGV
jgi:hypothetical protein